MILQKAQEQLSLNHLAAFLQVTSFAKLIELQILVEFQKVGRKFAIIYYTDDQALSGSYEIKTTILENEGTRILANNKYELVSTTIDAIDECDKGTNAACSIMVIYCNTTHKITLFDMQGQERIASVSAGVVVQGKMKPLSCSSLVTHKSIISLLIMIKERHSLPNL